MPDKWLCAKQIQAMTLRPFKYLFEMSDGTWHIDQNIKQGKNQSLDTLWQMERNKDIQ